MIEAIEAVGYVAVGFAGTFAAMEAAWRIALRGRHGVHVEKEAAGIHPPVVAKAK